MDRSDRLPGLPAERWDDDVRRILGITVRRTAPTVVGGGGPPPPDEPLPILTVMAHHAPYLEPFVEWATVVALGGALPRRANELLALRTAWNCRSEFEWGHHVVYGRAAGLTDDEVERVVAGPGAPGWTAADAVLLRVADELHATTDVADATWQELTRHYEPAALVEVPVVVGQYTMLSMLANACGVALEDGYPRLPPSLDTPGPSAG